MLQSICSMWDHWGHKKRICCRKDQQKHPFYCSISKVLFLGSCLLLVRHRTIDSLLSGFLLYDCQLRHRSLLHCEFLSHFISNAVDYSTKGVDVSPPFHWLFLKYAGHISWCYLHYTSLFYLILSSYFIG